MLPGGGEPERIERTEEPISVATPSQHRSGDRRQREDGGPLVPLNVTRRLGGIADVNPPVESALEDPDVRQSLCPKRQRRPDAGDLVGSDAVRHDRLIARERRGEPVELPMAGAERAGDHAGFLLHRER